MTALVFFLGGEIFFVLLFAGYLMQDTIRRTPPPSIHTPISKVLSIYWSVYIVRLRGILANAIFWAIAAIITAFLIAASLYSASI